MPSNLPDQPPKWHVEMLRARPRRLLSAGLPRTANLAGRHNTSRGSESMQYPLALGYPLGHPARSSTDFPTAAPWVRGR